MASAIAFLEPAGGFFAYLLLVGAIIPISQRYGRKKSNLNKNGCHQAALKKIFFVKFKMMFLR
jgi:hypothetical protein